MQESHNIFDLLEAIDTSGSLYDMLEQGHRNIDHYDVPDDLKDAWEDLYSVFQDFDREISTVYRLLGKVERDYDENKEF